MSCLRSELSALKNKHYFNYGGQGPLPESSLEAILKSWQQIQELGPFTNDVWPYIADEINKTKNLIANFCGVTTSRVALTENVTSGCILALWGLSFSKGERIVISNCEHPGVVAACKELARRKALEIDILDVQSLRKGVMKESITNDLIIKRLQGILTAKTKLVVISHLLWNTGEIMPIELIAEMLHLYPSNPFLLVDAAQSFCQIPIKQAASTADIYAFTGHKWAFGPEGLGAVILSRRVLESANPTLVGWKSISHEGSIYKDSPNPFHVDARKFEIATSCTPLLAGLRNSIELLETEGTDIERIEKIKLLSKKLWVELKNTEGIETVLEGPPPAGIVSFSMNSVISPKKIVKTLGKQSLWIRVLEDPIWLRACVHIPTNKKEINKLISVLREIALKGKGLDSTV